MTDFAEYHPWETTMNLSNLQLNTVTDAERRHRICLLTKGYASHGHMAQAIELNKDNRLIDVYHSVFTEDFEQNEDSLTNGYDIVRQSIYNHCHLQAIGTGCVFHHMVKFTRSSFIRTTQYVEYGSCTRCYRALPMGTLCFPCLDNGHTRRGVRIYFVTTPQAYEPPYHVRGEEQRREYQYQLLSDTAREYCDPIELAHQLYGQEITASLSWNRYNDEDDHGEYNYMVSERKYFRVYSLQRLIIDLKDRARHAYLLGPGTIFNYEKSIQIGANVTATEVQSNVDDIIATMPTFYTAREQVLIYHNRASSNNVMPSSHSEE